jgi:hypothetical protein
MKPGAYDLMTWIITSLSPINEFERFFLNAVDIGGKWLYFFQIHCKLADIGESIFAKFNNRGVGSTNRISGLRSAICLVF